MRKKAKICPHLRKPCIEEDCTHWTGYPVERINELTNAKVTEVVYMCDDLWRTKMAFDALRLADYTGSSIDTLRADVAVGQDNLIKALGNDIISGPDNAFLPRQ